MKQKPLTFFGILAGLGGALSFVFDWFEVASKAVEFLPAIKAFAPLIAIMATIFFGLWALYEGVGLLKPYTKKEKLKRKKEEFQRTCGVQVQYLLGEVLEAEKYGHLDPLEFHQELTRLAEGTLKPFGIHSPYLPPTHREYLHAWREHLSRLDIAICKGDIAAAVEIGKKWAHP